MIWNVIKLFLVEQLDGYHFVFCSCIYWKRIFTIAAQSLQPVKHEISFEYATVRLII